MKLWIKILIAVLVILVLFFSAAYTFVAVKGKALLAKKIEDALKREVSIGYLGLKMPLNLEIEDLKIEKLANINYIYLSPSFLGLLEGKIILNEVKILKPEISLEKSLREPVTQTQGVLDTQGSSDPPGTENKKLLPIIIKHLSIKEGIINFIDRTISESGIKITLKEVSLDVDNLYLFPGSAITNFQLTAKIPWQVGSTAGTVFASGWINPYKKDIQARLVIEGIDGVYLHPYYSYWVDLENSRIEKASLNFSSDIQGQNNEVVAQCRLELTDIKFKPRPPDQPEHKAEKIATAVLGIFRALNQGRVVLSFTIKTKMDRPEFKFDSVSSAVDKTISQAIKSDKVKVEDVALLPGKFVEGMAKGATGATKAIINGALSVGKSLKDAILDTLKKPEEKPEEERVGDMVIEFIEVKELAKELVK